MNEHFFIYNNNFFRVGMTVIRADNCGLRYGDGLFETMRMHEGKILNVDFHFERFFQGMKMLQFDIPEDYSSEFFIERVNELLLKNSISKNARIRLMIFRSEGNIFDVENNFPNYIIETSSLPEKIALNENGLVVDIFPDAKKSCDRFSNLKSNNYLPFVLAAKFAQKNKLDDAILLNAFGRICESSIANIFLLKNNKIYTPPLSEGCVAGVTRRSIVETFSLKKFSIEEKKLSVDDIFHSDEIFLTNSIQPIRWVKNFRGKVYGSEKVQEIFRSVVEDICGKKL
jgi:branched-chain amino acid aminotransferase